MSCVNPRREGPAVSCNNLLRINANDIGFTQQTVVSAGWDAGGAWEGHSASAGGVGATPQVTNQALSNHRTASCNHYATLTSAA